VIYIKIVFLIRKRQKKKQKIVKIQEISVFGVQDLKKHHRSCSYIKRKLQYKYLEGDAEERSLKKPPA